MSQKLEFIEKATKPGANISALCVEYGISRQSGHKWLRRYREQGYAGLVEHSRRPASSPLATAEEIVVSIVELRDKHPSYGPQKIARVLARRLGPSTPSASTVARVLRRLGKMKRKRYPVRVWTVAGRPRVEVKARTISGRSTSRAGGALRTARSASLSPYATRSAARSSP